MAVFLSVVKAVDTAPHDSLFAAGCPCTSAVGRSAFSADEQFGQRVFSAVFALLGSRADLFDLAFRGSSCQFLLHLGEGIRIDNRRMIVFYIIPRPFSGVDAYLLADVVLGLGFAQQSISFVFFIGQERLDYAGLP